MTATDDWQNTPGTITVTWRDGTTVSFPVARWRSDDRYLLEWHNPEGSKVVQLGALSDAALILFTADPPPPPPGQVGVTLDTYTRPMVLIGGLRWCNRHDDVMDADADRCPTWFHNAGDCDPRPLYVDAVR